MTNGVDLNHAVALPDLTDLDFVFHKATQGINFTDPLYETRRGYVRSLGKLWGAYHFITTTDDIAQQVDRFVAVSNAQPGDILALDFENDNTWYNWHPSDLADLASEFMNELALMMGGHRCVLYCNEDTYVNVVHRFNVDIHDGLWIADYSGEPTHQQVLWQYASDTIDRDKGYFTDLAAMRDWANKIPDALQSARQQSILNQE